MSRFFLFGVVWLSLFLLRIGGVFTTLLSSAALPPPRMGGVAFSFSLLGGAAFLPPSFWVCCLPLPPCGGAAVLPCGTNCTQMMLL